MSKHMRDIEACAAQWILRRDRGEFTREERVELESWLGADARHRDTYLRFDEAWRASAALKAWRPADGRVNTAVLPITHNARRPRSNRVFALAASLVLVVTAAIVCWQYMQSGVYATLVGGYQRVLLDDGSIVQLNTDTRVRVRLTDDRREVQLLRGEAYFKIAHDVNRPFDVVTEDTVVRAVGTAFNVHRESNGRTRVVVKEGKVSLSFADAGRAQPVDGHAAKPGGAHAPSAWMLSAGDIAEAKPSGVSVAKAEPEELDRLLSWQEGELHFKKQTLGSVVEQFNRYNPRRLEIASPELAAAEVDGNFKTNDLDSFVASMRSALGVEIEQTKDVIRIHAPPSP